MIRLYTTFLHPLVHPFFFKINTIERLVDTRLGNANLWEYNIIIEPSYRIGRTRGFKEIYAFLEINERAYNNILNNNSFRTENDFYWINNFLTFRNLEQINFDDVAEVHVRYYLAPIKNREFWGFFSTTHSIPGRESYIFMVLTKDVFNVNNYITERYYLHIFNINETRCFRIMDFRNISKE